MYLKELRQNKHLSQEQLASESGLSLRTIQRIESGHRVGYASLRALAVVFNVNVDSLEQELYSMDKMIHLYKEYPLWLRLYIGSGWFSASRQEFRKIEIFFLVMGIIFSIGCVVGTVQGSPLSFIGVFGSLCGFLGAYNCSITIRVGDKYDVWSRLEPTLPSGIFGFFKALYKKKPQAL